jgi:hypothetical protein
MGLKDPGLFFEHPGVNAWATETGEVLKQRGTTTHNALKED